MTKTPFFVTGLPRSGTAWMATFLSGCPGVACTHEALRHLDRIEDLPEALLDAPHSGTADSALPLFLDEVEAMYPEARWILLDRAETASRASIAAFLGHEPAPGLYEAARAPLARIREKALVIPFEELTWSLSAFRALERIGVNLFTPEGDAVRRWYDHMMGLRVEVKKEVYMDLKLDTPIARKILGHIREGVA